MPRIYYLGQFGKAVGGVTVKNKCLFSFYQINGVDLKKIDLSKVKHFSIPSMFELVKCFILKRQLIIGMSNKGRNRFIKLLHSFKKKNLQQSVVFIMGGTFHNEMKDNEKLRKLYLLCKHIFVENPVMLQSLNDLGFYNVSLLPNCRAKNGINVVPSKNDKLRCLFFSLICPEKGVDLICQASQLLPDVEFGFYGSVVSDYKPAFDECMGSNQNCSYYGVFSDGEDKKTELINQWDLLLLPTRYKGEGMPGIIVEAKMSGIVPVVSNFPDASFLVKKDNGIIMEEYSIDCLVKSINKFCDNKDLLLKMKQASLADIKRFTFDAHKDELLDVLK